jgi:diguanylate cyclase (GGDEF)-like protein
MQSVIRSVVAKAGSAGHRAIFWSSLVEGTHPGLGVRWTRATKVGLDMTVGLPRITPFPVQADSGAGDVADTDAVNAAVRAAGPGGEGLRDPLTGVAHWQLWADHCAAALARAARNGWSTALLVVDVDQFHQINNRFGHACGDSVLVEVARRLSAGFRPYDTVGRFGDTLARLGGDEFVILCENVADPAAARSLGRRVCDLLEAPVAIHDGEILVTAGVGVTLAPPDKADVEGLIVRADGAMRQAKQEGVGRVVIASDMGAAEVSLRRALACGELRLRYQAKVALESDRVVGVEALIYWQHPQRGMVPPYEFIPLAEQTGLIVPIGSWVIEEACRQAALWQRSFQDIPALMVSVNVSACQFGPGLVDVVARALSAHAVDPRTLCLEVTESVLMQDTEAAVTTLQELTALGVSLSIDDFGTGYSSLSYLKRLPLHEVKIDKSFVDGLGKNDQDAAIVAAIVAMAHALGLSVVAEGVETADQLQRLRTLGCEQAQGYHLAPPGPPDAIDVLLRAETSVGWRSHAPQDQGCGAASETYRPNRILVVDDDATVRQLARMSLASVGFEVHEAADGASALSTAIRISPDCVLLDVAMFGMSGLEVCRALRAQPLTAQCTILMLTVLTDARDKIDAFASGADDYIIKPFSPRGLVSRVHSAMRRRRQDPSLAAAPATPQP